MKAVRFSIMLLCAATFVFSSCTDDSLKDGINQEDKTSLLKDIDIVSRAGTATKTALAEDGKTVNWISGEVFKGFLTAGETTVLAENDPGYNVIDGGCVEFTHSFTGVSEMSEYTYNVLYPASAYKSGNPSSIIAAMPVDQIAPAGQMAGNSDILIAKTMTINGVVADKVDVYFKRMSAMWKVNIKNFALGEGETIVAVGLQVPGKKISGEFGLNLTDGTAEYAAGTAGGYDGMVKVTLSAPVTDGADFTVIFNSLPCTLAAGDAVQIDVYTNDGVITSKSISVPAGVVLEAGSAAKFSVDMKEDIAFGKSVTGNCTCGGDPTNLTRNKSFYWQLGGEHDAEHFAVIDLAATSAFDYIELAMDAGAYATHVTVLGSNDGTEFTQISDVTGWAGEAMTNPDGGFAANMVVMPITFSQVSYRYVKLVFAESSSQWAITLLQASVYKLSASEGIGISSYTEGEDVQ